MSKPDNTQEPDYTHPDEMPTVEHRPCLSSDLRGMIVHFTSEMLDNPNDYGIYPTTNFYSDLGEAILDWHNKQIEARTKRLNDLWTTIMIDEVGSEKAFAYREAIEAQLKERDMRARLTKLEAEL